MKKSPKRPRTFARSKAKPYPQKKQQPQSRRISDGLTAFYDEISPGFAKWYKQNYDEHGKFIREEIWIADDDIADTESQLGVRIVELFG